MYHCNLFTGKKYYLRLFLTIVQRAKSFQDLYIVNKILHYTFQTTYITGGLLEGDQE